MVTERKKALLVTWTNGCNYGTALQCYCLKKIIEDPTVTGFCARNDLLFDVDVNVLNYDNSKGSTTLLGKMRRAMIGLPKMTLAKISNKMKAYRGKFVFKKYEQQILKRERIFDDFRKNEFDFFPSAPVHDNVGLKSIDEFDYYIVGSDQVWNPSLLDSVYLLGWADSGKNKFSYAPSLCVENIPDDKKACYEAIKDFEHISVRENNEAAKQLAGIVRKDVSVVVDPVLLYGREALLKLCKRTLDGSDYILSYFLGDTKDTRKFFIGFAKKNKKKMKSIICVNPLHSYNDVRLARCAEWDVGPTKIIDKIFNSEIVFTDSFHVVVMAILLHKNFVVLPREQSKDQQNNRIIALLKLVGLERLYNYRPENGDEVDISELQWRNIDSIIDGERKKSFDFLVNCIGCLREEKNETI